MSPWDLPSLTQLALDAPPVVRGAVGLAGALVLLWGARLYRPGLLLGAFGAGAMGAVGALHTLATWLPAAADPTTIAVGAVSTGVVGAVVAHLAHQLALVVLGTLVGLVGAAALSGGLALPWWIVPIGAGLGALTMPKLYAQLLKFVTPAIGAALVAWAVGRPDSLWVVGGLWFVGTSFQLRGRREPDDEEER